MLLKSFLNRFRFLFPQKITGKLALVMFLMVGLLISVLGVTLTHLTEEVLIMKVRTSHEEIANRAAREIALFTQRPLELLSVAGKLIGRTHGTSWTQETVLVEMSLQFPMFSEIVSLDSQGREIATSNPGRVVQNKQQSEGFQKALKGETFLSPVTIGRDYFPQMDLAVPYEQKGKVAGVLMATVNLRGIWNIVDGIYIGKTGRALVVSKEGLLIAHPDKKLVLRNTNLMSNPAFQNLILKHAGSVEYRALDKKRYLASVALVPGNPPLAVVIQIEEKEAYALLGHMRFLIWSVLIISLLVSIGVSYGVARWMVHPIQALKEWSRKVASGDFDYRVAPQSLDEIGRLFLRFKRMSQRLKMAREKERFASLGMMATTLSHKLKNSIVFLKTFAQLYPQRKHDAHFMERFERDFSSSVDYLEQVFRNLSQVASSRDLKIEAVDLPAVFQSVHRAYLDTMIKIKVDFRMEITGYLPEIQGDREQLQELFVNLIQNSVQAMPRGGHLALTAFYDSQANHIQVSISDNGSGISAKNLSQIFKPFFTTKNGGMGIGLAISKKIVDEHKGSISVMSEEGQGTVFILRLPVRKKIKISNPDLARPSEAVLAGF